MKRLCLVLLAALAPLAWAEKATYKLTVQGKEVGTLKTDDNLLPGGKLAVRAIMEMTGPDGVKVVFDHSARFSAAGRPETSSMVVTSKGKRVRMDATFDAKGANVTLDDGNKKTRKSVAAPKGSNTADGSLFWFIRDKPKVGAKIAYAEFDPLTLEWLSQTVTYKGVVSITFKGKKTDAHLLEMTNSKQWLDDKGTPYRIEFENGLVAERL
jgi:hypothetical protein